MSINLNFEKNSSIRISFPDFSKERIVEENIGKNKNDFIPLKKIGNGAFGSLFKVKSKINNKIYAMKIMKKDNNPIMESSILKIVNHPNIVKYYTEFEDNHNYYIIIEYIKGQNLFDLYMSYKIQERLLEEKLIWKFLAQCLEAIIHIHGNGIIHRDIKFLNVMIDEKMNIKIIDFNSSAFMDISSAKRHLNNIDYESMLNHGTEVKNCFEAPEISQSSYNAKVDVFSLGRIFYELCHIHNLNDSVYQYSNELQCIIQKMLINNPVTRPTINEIYNKYFEKYYSIKYFKYTSIFSCLHCLYNFPIWTKYLKNDKNKNLKELSKNFFHYITFKNKQNFEEYIKQFKKNKLKMLLCNNDKCEEIEPIAFINFIMAKLNEELNTVVRRKKYENVVYENLKKERCKNYTRKYNTNIHSVITENFLGLLKLKIECNRCNVKDYKFNYFYYLSFNMEFLIKKIKDLNYANIFDLLIVNEIEKKMFCKNCEQETKHLENIVIFSPPKNLILFFDRKKIDSNYNMNYYKINFPEILILDNNRIECFISKKPDEIQYCLYAILCQIQNDNNDKIYISFTREVQNINEYVNNNNREYYNLDYIKENYNIIGLFYCSDAFEIKNDFPIGQNVYKMNSSNQLNLLLNNNISNITFNTNDNIINNNYSNNMSNSGNLTNKIILNYININNNEKIKNSTNISYDEEYMNISAKFNSNVDVENNNTINNIYRSYNPRILYNNENSSFIPDNNDSNNFNKNINSINHYNSINNYRDNISDNNKIYSNCQSLYNNNVKNIYFSTIKFENRRNNNNYNNNNNNIKINNSNNISNSQMSNNYSFNNINQSVNCNNDIYNSQISNNYSFNNINQSVNCNNDIYNSQISNNFNNTSVNNYNNIMSSINTNYYQNRSNSHISFNNNLDFNNNNPDFNNNNPDFNNNNNPDFNNNNPDFNNNYNENNIINNNDYNNNYKNNNNYNNNNYNNYIHNYN